MAGRSKSMEAWKAVLIWIIAIIVLSVILGEIKSRYDKKKNAVTKEENQEKIWYQHPEFLREPNDKYWKDEELRNWHNSAQYYVKYTIRQELNIPEESFWPAYWLGKNLWYQCAAEEEIREQLEQYAKSLLEE